MAPALYHSTSALHRLSKCLKDLKPSLRTLSRSRFGDISKRTRDAFDDLCQKQEANSLSPSPDGTDAELLAYSRWEHLSDLEEGYLKQKSKLHWMNVGDKSNKVFFRAIRIRETKNTIREVVGVNGVVSSDPAAIKAEAERHFREFLSYSPLDFQGMETDALEELLNVRCSMLECEQLIREVSDEEVTKVVFSMPNNKSPGPDGFTTEFFKGAWSIIGQDVKVAVQSFFRFGFLPKGINSTILALIPKKNDAREMKDYRPISCCNVLYKIISKILANRLKSILPSIIAPNQSAFVRDRLLVENVLLASEIVKDYHKDSKPARCAMMIDIAKAFDTVQWSFLLNVLTALGLPPTFIHWIRLCISTASFSVQVNGELIGYFQSSRGLRQGCALSPYLFVLCMNVLSKMLDRAAAERRVGYHHNCSKLNLTHLCFADDLMVFTDGKLRSLEGIVDVFNEFAVVSGLRISIEKSTLFMSGCDATRLDIVARFPFSQGELPVRYLGLPLMTKRMTKADYAPLVEGVRKQISVWTARHLSFAGRLQLLISVISGLTNFWISAFYLPKSCIKEIDSICSAFLWSGPSLNKGKAKVSWIEICKPKVEGGLGIRSLNEVNKVCCLKLIWRLSSATSLWVKWIKEYLLRGKSFWSIPAVSLNGSWIWRKMLRTRTLAKDFHRMEVNNGEDTSFWFDDWCSMGRLVDTTGERGHIDLGIPANASLAAVWSQRRRRRRHRSAALTNIESSISSALAKRNARPDQNLWRSKNDCFLPRFSAKHTLENIRSPSPRKAWSYLVWFQNATPKFAFITWLAILDRLSTGDRMALWGSGISTTCVLCSYPMETREHLFFECNYSLEVWKNLSFGLLGRDYTYTWDEIVSLLSMTNLPPMKLFLARYVFQASISSLWRERNGRRHGDIPKSSRCLVGELDKTVRNRISSLRTAGDLRYEEGLSTWFNSRTQA